MIQCTRLLRFAALCLVSLVSACGGGGSGGNSTAPPSGLQYTATSAFTVNVAISALNPTVTGTVTSYTISPALPAGLGISASTGVISGTPTAVTPATSYTVTASNSGGSTTATLSIAVNSTVATVAYPSAYYGFTAGVVAQTITPTTGGGAVVSWSVTPALPAGLTLNTSNGEITGNPTAASAPTNYTITATNSGGNATAHLTIAVAGTGVLNLGHSDTVVVMRANSASVVSLDQEGHWVLQNYSSGAILAEGDGACSLTVPCGNDGSSTPVYPHVDLAGSTMIDGTASGLEVRSASAGTVLGTISGTFSWYQLAADGSYVTTGSKTALTVWSKSGQQLFTQSGDYSAALAFSAAGQVQIAKGPAGQTVIQTITVPGGSSTTSASFQGTFASWFLDGSGRFLTYAPGTVWVYSSAAVQQSVTQVAGTTGQMGGQGNFFWLTVPQQALYIYSITGAAPPQTVTTSGLLVASGTTLALLPNDNGQFLTYDLSGTSASQAIIQPLVDGLSDYVTIPGGSWLIGNADGVIFDGASLNGQARYLADGRAMDIAGGTSYYSVATASGSIFTYDATSNALVSTVGLPTSQLAANSTGTVVAAAARGGTLGSTDNLYIYSMPAGSVLATYTPRNGGGTGSEQRVSLSLSGAGDILAASIFNTSGCSFQVVEVSGGAPILCNNASGLIWLSPDGTQVAAASGTAVPQTYTNIYKNGTLVTTVQGSAVGWIDNGHILVDTYKSGPPNQFTGSVIYDSQGNIVSQLALPEMQYLDTMTSATLYSPATNSIYSVTTGAPTWTSADQAGNATYTNVGAATGSQIVFMSGALVLAQPYSAPQ